MCTKYWLVKLAQTKVFRFTDRPDMTIAVYWGVRPHAGISFL